jgi:hypothetical protein
MIHTRPLELNTELNDIRVNKIVSVSQCVRHFSIFLVRIRVTRSWSFGSGFFAFLDAFFRSRYNLGVEILALRRLWPAETHALVIVKPQTVVGWHRAGFRLRGELLRARQ